MYSYYSTTPKLFYFFFSYEHNWKKVYLDKVIGIEENYNFFVSKFFAFFSTVSKSA
jgi:hypothetical protein